MYSKILIVVTSSPACQAAVVEGVALAKAHDAEALFFSVLPCYVVPVADMPMVGMLSPDQFQREAAANAERYLAAATVVAEKAGVRSKHAVGAGPDDAECIVEAARKRCCGLIVAASSGRNAVISLLDGSVVPGLITRSTIPVLVVRQACPARKDKREAPVPAKPRLLPRSAEAPLRARHRMAA